MHKSDPDLNPAAVFGMALIAAILSGVISHFILQMFVFLISHRSSFDNLDSLLINTAVATVVLLVGWATRRVFLVCGLFLVFGIYMLISILMHLKSTTNGVLVQTLVYVGFPIMFTAFFELLRRTMNIPLRGTRS